MAKETSWIGFTSENNGSSSSHLNSMVVNIERMARTRCGHDRHNCCSELHGCYCCCVCGYSFYRGRNKMDSRETMNPFSYLLCVFRHFPCNWDLFRFSCGGGVASSRKPKRSTLFKILCVTTYEIYVRQQ